MARWNQLIPLIYGPKDQKPENDCETINNRRALVFHRILRSQLFFDDYYIFGRKGGRRGKTVFIRGEKNEEKLIPNIKLSTKISWSEGEPQSTTPIINIRKILITSSGHWQQQEVCNI